MAEGNSTTHPIGYLKERYSKEFNCWKAMLSRCYSRRNVSYKYCGARGVVVCDRWRRSFTLFLEDMGPAPTGKHSLDRYPDRTGNYEPGNVRWATAAEQQENTCKVRWIDYAGRCLPISEWAKITGIRQTTILARIDTLGWTDEDALTTIPESECLSMPPCRAPSCRRGPRPRYFRDRKTKQAAVVIDRKTLRLGKFGSLESLRRYWQVIIAAGYTPPNPLDGKSGKRSGRTEKTAGNKRKTEAHGTSQSAASHYRDLPFDL